MSLFLTPSTPSFTLLHPVFYVLSSIRPTCGVSTTTKMREGFHSKSPCTRGRLGVTTITKLVDQVYNRLKKRHVKDNEKEVRLYARQISLRKFR